MHILHQDDALLAVDKPAGIATNPGGWETDASNLLQNLEAQVGRLWIVHRLDRGTSGVVVFARTAEAHRSLSLLFEQHRVRKVYHAIAAGLPPWQAHTARQPLRGSAGRSHRSVVDEKLGKPCETGFSVLERFAAFCLLDAVPATGRTHQVRAHAAALGFPLAGDRLYHGPAVEWIARPALHACSLAFEFEGQPFSFSAPYPPDLLQALELLRSAKDAA